jgi:uncharacterized BrkB/YihY/UPF0761 family membrane protein
MIDRFKTENSLKGVYFIFLIIVTCLYFFIPQNADTERIINGGYFFVVIGFGLFVKKKINDLN